MASPAKKIEFNYIVQKLIEWYCEEKQFSADTDHRITQFNQDNDFSLIKIIKLLFFVSTAEGENSSLLNGNFKDFYALPYGPVEGEIYNYIKSVNHKIELGTFQREKLDLKQLTTSNTPDESSSVDKAIDRLKSDAGHIILTKPFELVEISHKRLSWKSAFSEAEQKGKASEPMSLNLMMKEKKYYA